MNAPDVPRIDLNLLTVFHAIYAERHLTRAGQRLGLTQPAMSHALARLRTLLGDELFLRAPNGVEPTQRAIQLAEPIGSALGTIQRALTPLTDFDPRRATNTFRLGLPDYEDFVLSPLLADCLSQIAPAVNLRVRDVPTWRALELLDQGELDLAVGVFEPLPSRYARRTIFRESLVTLVRSGHPALDGGMTLETFVRLPHLLVSYSGEDRGKLDRRLAARGLKRRVAVTTPHFLAAPFIVEKSDMIAVVRGRTARFGDMCAIETHPVPIEVPALSITLVWHRRSQSDIALQWLIERITALV